MENEKFKFIFSPQLAKHLVRAGFMIVDLKKAEEGGTIFIFRDSMGIVTEIDNWDKNKKVSK